MSDHTQAPSKDQLSAELYEAIKNEPGKCITVHRSLANRILTALRAENEPPAECKQCDELIGERDRAQDALQDTHLALGGDGEWKGKLPPEPAPDSGDLHLDVPELARERMTELERMRAAQPNHICGPWSQCDAACAERAYPPPSHALRDVAAERERQRSVEGWTPEHDDKYDPGELATAATCYVLNAACVLSPANGTPMEMDEDQHGGLSLDGIWWPWDRRWWKPSTPRRDLVKAGALILAEIERLDRATATKAPEHG
jgi:hypothetical protein